MAGFKAPCQIHQRLRACHRHAVVVQRPVYETGCRVSAEYDEVPGERDFQAGPEGPGQRDLRVLRSDFVWAPVQHRRRRTPATPAARRLQRRRLATAATHPAHPRHRQLSSIPASAPRSSGVLVSVGRAAEEGHEVGLIAVGGVHRRGQLVDRRVEAPFGGRVEIDPSKSSSLRARYGDRSRCAGCRARGRSISARRSAESVAAEGAAVTRRRPRPARRSEPTGSTGEALAAVAVPVERPR